MISDIRAEHSLIQRAVAAQSQTISALLEAEVRWHYSQHFLSESKGEEVIEDMLLLSQNKRQRSLLGAQLRDEKSHKQLFEEIVDKIGLDSRASSYADAYSCLVKDQRSLPEKVYVFQIITEAASAAYCDWRLKAMTNPDFNNVDATVMQDELRHLVMGGSMLSMCEKDDIRENLSHARRMQLVREMNEICRTHGQTAMYQNLLIELPEEHQLRPASSALDRSVSRTVLGEVRKIENMISNF